MNEHVIHNFGCPANGNPGVPCNCDGADAVDDSVIAERDFDGSQVLAKASYDPWRYLIGLRNGMVVVCREVEKRGDFVLLIGVDSVNWQFSPGAFNTSFDRGIEVRLGDIMFCADEGP